MAKQISFGVDGIARTVSTPYIGINSVARTVSEGDIGVSGIARRFHGVSKIYKESKTKVGTNSFYLSPMDYFYYGTDYVFNEETGKFSLKAPYGLMENDDRAYLAVVYVIVDGDTSCMYSMDVRDHKEDAAEVRLTHVGSQMGLSRNETSETAYIYKHTATRI